MAGLPTALCLGHAIEAVLYEDHVTTVQLIGKGKNDHPTGITATAAGPSGKRNSKISSWSLKLLPGRWA